MVYCALSLTPLPSLLPTLSPPCPPGGTLVPPVQGVAGELDTSIVTVGALDVAIALTMKLGCHSLTAKRLLLSALIIRRLRTALVVRCHPCLRPSPCPAASMDPHMLTHACHCP